MGTAWIIGLSLLLQSLTPEQLQVEHNGQRIENINRSEFSLPHVELPFVDVDRFIRLLNRLDKKVYRAPINATFDSRDRIVREQVGFKLDRLLAAERLYGRLLSSGNSRLELPTVPLYPKVDAELLANIRVQLIGYYVTYFNSRNDNRFTNIKLAAQAINNTVLFPGETFSFNRVVGMRTEQRGYKRAKIIVRGEYSEGVGGGICQVSSTLYNAVDRAGLAIVERYSHSRNVPYVPPGRDATVSWGGPDFTFKNKYNQPILIRAVASEGKVVVTIMSSDVIAYKPRHIPNAAQLLPEEIRTES